MRNFERETNMGGNVNRKKSKTSAVLLSFGISLAFSGCALSPGMYFGAKPSEGSSSEVTDAGQVIRFIPINIETLAQLKATSAVDAAAGGPSFDDDRRPYAYRIGAGDILRLVIWDHPEFNNPGSPNGVPPLPGTTTGDGGASLGAGAALTGAAAGNSDPAGRVVQSDGTIFVPYVGVVKVSGLTVEAVRSRLRSQLGPYIKDPQLDVSIVGFRSKKIIVSGEVRQPGTITIDDRIPDVANIISQAGGVTGDADQDHVTLNRNGRQFVINLYDLFAKGDQTQNYRLQSGDVLNIPNNRSNKIFLMGEFGRGRALPVPSGGYSLAEAISDAGNISQLTSNPKYLYVIRRDPKADLTNVFYVDAMTPVGISLTDQFPLRPRDIVYVDPAEVTRFARVVAPLVSLSTSANDLSNTTK